MVDHELRENVVARLPSGMPIRVAQHHYTGDSEGPTVYMQAAQHGREINGTEVLRRLHDRLRRVSLQGEVIAVPVADPLTFDRQSYTAPEEFDSISPNMNRVWPGDPKGTLHERLAAGLWDQANDADLLIDLHTATREILPHVVYTAGDSESERIARAFGTDLHLAEPAGEAAESEWHERDFGGKFRVAAHRNGMPCITPELGDSRLLDETAVGIGVTGVLNALRAQSLLEGSPTENGEPRRRQNHLARTQAAESGLFRAATDVELGQEVTEGRHLGTLYAPETYEVIQEATAENDGILYALTREAVVTAGDRLASVAIPVDSE